MANAQKEQEKHRRKSILQSHMRLGNFLDIDIINTLMHLFDKNYNEYVNQRHKITTYIEDERRAQHLEKAKIKIKTKISGFNTHAPYLYIGIIKNGKDFIHLTIHLVIEKLKSKNSGIIHITRNVYRDARVSKGAPFYALITVKPAKERSLIFELDERQNAANARAPIADEVKAETNVILTVLNRLFDEDNPEFYVGTPQYSSRNRLNPIHPFTEKAIININNMSLGTRKNKNKSFPLFTKNMRPSGIEEKLPRSATPRPAKKKGTRKKTGKK